jgi:hypothetical protein
MSKPSVYLGGHITGLTFDEALAWRTIARARLEPDIEVIDPLRGLESLRGKGVIVGSYKDNPLTTSRGIMSRDRADVKRSNAVLMNLLELPKMVSRGSCVEVGWSDAWRKILILLMEPENVHQHPMVCEAASYVLDDLEDGLSITRCVLLP